MSESGEKILAAAEEAAAVARGDKPAAAIWHNGHRYVSAEMVDALKAENEALKKALKDRTEADEKILIALEALPAATAHAVSDAVADALPLYGDPRPMSEAPRDGTAILIQVWATDPEHRVLAWDNQENGWREYSSDRLGISRDFIGWWPLPKGNG